MKRIIACLLSAAMLLSLASCGGTPTASSEEPVDSEEPVASEDPLAPRRLDWKDIDGDGVIRVACVGDSITAGSEPITYPNYLQEYLDFLSTVDGNRYEVKNHGKGGAAVRDEPENVGSRFYYDDSTYQSSLSYTPDVVIVQMGTNDGAYDNLANADSYFKNDYKTYFIDPYLAKGSTLVLATPPHASNGIHDSGVNGKISDLVREIAQENNLPLIDVNKLTEGRDESFPDGLHGNQSGYSLLAQIYFSRVFGGGLWRLNFTTEPGATIYFDIHMATADANGKASLTLLDSQASRNFELKVTCPDHKIYTDNVIVNGNMSLSCPLQPGLYDVTGSATATADSVYGNGDNTADKTLDGNPDTRWESNYKNGCWLLVDLGEVKQVNGVNILWEGAYAKEYDIETSSDGTTFATAASVTIDHWGEEITAFDPVDARYIRVNCKVRGTIFGNSIREFKALSDER